jgi:hypothetical protein
MPPQVLDGVIVTTGVGLTVMVKLIGVPVHAPEDGVTVMIAVTAVAVAFKAVNAAILPVPLAARPMEAVLLTQLKVVAVPVKFMAVVAVLLHTAWFATGFTAHCAFVFVKVVDIKNNNRLILKNCFLKLPFPICKLEEN